MAENEAPGEARVEDPVEDPVADPIDTDPFAVRVPEAVESADTPVAFDAVPPDPDATTFDAFNATTWNFRPAAAPWYRSRQAVTAMVAVAIAVVTLVVSVVLLIVHGPPGEQNLPATDSSAVPTTATTTATTSVVPPPLPPPPPPPPPPPSASEIQRAPVYAPDPRPTKKPEINVTRKPLSVSPQKPSGRQ